MRGFLAACLWTLVVLYSNVSPAEILRSGNEEALPALDLESEPGSHVNPDVLPPIRDETPEPPRFHPLAPGEPSVFEDVLRFFRELPVVRY